MRSNLNSNEGHQSDWPQAFEIDWVEYGVERVLDSQGRSRISDPALLNTSLDLSNEQSRLYQPFDPGRGVSVKQRPLWRSWPSFFRGCLYLRRVDGLLLLCSIRGELEHPNQPLASRYYNYGMWLLLPPEWFAPIEIPDLTAEELLADRLYSVIWVAMTRRPSDQVLPNPQRLRIEQKAFPYATLLPSLAKTAEVLAASREPKTYVAAEPQVLEATEVPEAAAAMETAAALLCHMIIAAWRTGNFEGIVRRGIALYPPPPPSEQHRFAWIVPRVQARTEAAVELPPTERSEPQSRLADRLTIDATFVDTEEAEIASLSAQAVEAISDSKEDSGGRRPTMRHYELAKYAFMLLIAIGAVGTIGAISYSILHINDKPRETCEGMLIKFNQYASVIPGRMIVEERERCNKMLWYRTVKLPYCLREIMLIAPWRSNHELGRRISESCQEILRCETLDGEAWDEPLTRSNRQIESMAKTLKFDSRVAEICHWDLPQMKDLNSSQ